jgi:hypothetical protein
MRCLTQDNEIGLCADCLAMVGWWDEVMYPWLHILRSRIDREPPPHWIREGK